MFPHQPCSLQSLYIIVSTKPHLMQEQMCLYRIGLEKET